MKNLNVMPRRILEAVLLFTMTIGFSGAVLAAEAYPAKPIRLIIPFSPGGGADLVGRTIALKMSERLGQQLVVDNRAGAGGVIGTEMVAKSVPDGYTLGFVPASFTMQPSLRKLPYDPIKSFSPVARVGRGDFVLVVHPTVPVKSVKEFITHARQNPGKLLLSATGPGSSSHMFLELFKMMAGVEFTFVHFKGGGQQVIDLLGGHTHGMMIGLPAVRPHILSGKLRAMGTTGTRRSAFLPDVPTIAEGGLPGYEATVWWGFLAPMGTPASVVNRLNKDLEVVLAMDEIAKFLANLGVEPLYEGPKVFVSFIKKEIGNWAAVVKKGNIKID